MTKKLSVSMWGAPAGLALLSFVLLFVVHRDAFSSNLRHAMVEDGSVSQFAGEFLSDAPIASKY